MHMWIPTVADQKGGDPTEDRENSSTGRPEHATTPEPDVEAGRGPLTRGSVLHVFTGKHWEAFSCSSEQVCHEARRIVNAALTARYQEGELAGYIHAKTSDKDNVRPRIEAQALRDFADWLDKGEWIPDDTENVNVVVGHCATAARKCATALESE